MKYLRWASAGWNDPFVQEVFILSPLLGMTASVLIASDEIIKSMDQVGIPFLILVRENDSLVNIPDSEALIQRTRSNDKQMKIIDHTRHLLFQDTPDVT